MDKEGIALLGNLWAAIERMHVASQKIGNRDISEAYDLMILAAHRLAFLEMVTKGLSYMEMHDAQAYAKFVDKKRKIEDLDIDELRVLLR
jgi:hypothetical protein